MPRARPLQIHHAYPWKLAMHPDGKRLVTTGHDGQIRIWDLDAERLVATLDNGLEGVTVVFHPDGRRLIAPSRQSSIRVWDLDRASCVWTSEPVVHGINSVKLCADRDLLVSGYGGDAPAITGAVWDLARGTRLRTFDAEIYYGSFWIYPDQHRVLWHAASGGLAIWNLDQARCERAWVPDETDGEEGLATCELSRDGRVLVTGGEFGLLARRDPETLALAWECQAHDDEIQTLVIDAPRDLVVTIGEDETVRAWSLADGRERAHWAERAGSSLEPAYEPAAGLLWTVGRDHRVVVYHLDSPGRTTTWKADAQLTRALALPGGRALAAAANGDVLLLEA